MPLIAKRVVLSVFAGIWLLMLGYACAPALREQQSLAQLSNAVTAQCVAAVGGQVRNVCSRAKVCVRSIKSAEEATQLSVEALAKGTPDDILDVQAAALVAGAKATCLAACFDAQGKSIAGCGSIGRIEKVAAVLGDMGPHDASPRAPNDAGPHANPTDRGIK